MPAVRLFCALLSDFALFLVFLCEFFAVSAPHYPYSVTQKHKYLSFYIFTNTAQIKYNYIYIMILRAARCFIIKTGGHYG